MHHVLERPKRRLQPIVAVAAIASAALAATLLATTPASAATTNLTPTANSPAAPSGQGLSSLATRNYTGGTASTWANYVEFSGTYTGTQTFTLTGVTPSSVTGLELHINYRGPISTNQTWTWAAQKAGTTTYTNFGTNAGAPNWGAWKELVLTLPTSAADPASNYVAANGSIVVRLKSNNSSDAANIDWESLTVTSGSTTTPTPTATPTPTSTPTTPPAGSYTKPTALWKFDYQLGGGYVPANGVKMVVRDRFDTVLSGVYNVCYVNFFQTQPGTDASVVGTTAWWIANHLDLLLTKNNKPLYDPGWPDEALIDTKAANKTALVDIIGPWIDKCAADGFKAVEADNLDSFTRTGLKTKDGTAGTNTLTKANNFALLTAIVSRAHTDGLAFAQKNAQEYTADAKAAGTDFAITEDCGLWSECGPYFDAYKVGTTNTALVFDVEYIDNPDHEAGTPTGYQNACNTNPSIGFVGRISIIEREEDVLKNGHYASCSGS